MVFFRYPNPCAYKNQMQLHVSYLVDCTHKVHKSSRNDNTKKWSLYFHSEGCRLQFDVYIESPSSSSPALRMGRYFFDTKRRAPQHNAPWMMACHSLSCANRYQSWHQFIFHKHRRTHANTHTGMYTTGLNIGRDRVGRPRSQFHPPVSPEYSKNSLILDLAQDG